MDGKSPIIKSGDKIILMTPNVLQQMTTVCIIGDIILIPFSIILYPTTDGAPGMIAFLWILAFIVTFGAFGFKSKYIFDSTQKQIFMEGTSFFIPYKKMLCNYSDVAVIGIQTRTYNHKGRTMYSYYLVYSTKHNPSRFHKLATNEGINHVLKISDLNMMGQLLSKTIECPFKAVM